MRKFNILILLTLLFIVGLVTQFLDAAQYDRQIAPQKPFAQKNNTTAIKNNPATITRQPQPQQPRQTRQPQQPQQQNRLTKPRPLPQPIKNSDISEVQFSGELFDMRILDNDEETIVAPRQLREIAPNQNGTNNQFVAPDEARSQLKVITPVEPNHVPSAGFLRYSEDYPDPRSIGTVPYVRGGIAPIPYSVDRHAAVPEEEVHHRFHVDEARKLSGQPPLTAADCPLCKDDPKTPCGRCPKCKLGYPCERTVCRHCVQPVSHDLNNFCDLTAGGEPCGTCDSCREHRSDPCAHADDGRGPNGEWNPYKQSRIFAVMPRIILDEWNNGARKFPVYYNPAPYYRPYWNPSLYAGYARPYTFRYTCPVCSEGICRCDKPPFAGQVPFAYACKFCNRNPCACAEDICDKNAEMQPSGRSNALENARSKSTRIQDAELRNQKNDYINSPDSTTNPDTNANTIPQEPTEENNNNDRNVLDLFNERTQTNSPDKTTPKTPNKRQTLDAPKSQTPGVIPNTGVVN
jgi:hypothetical protein